MVRFIRLSQSGEFVGMCFPIEIAAVYDGSAYTGGMSVHIFGGRVSHNVGSPFKRTTVDGSGESIVDNQRHPVLVGNTCKLLNVEHIDAGV